MPAAVGADEDPHEDCNHALGQEDMEHRTSDPLNVQRVNAPLGGRQGSGFRGLSNTDVRLDHGQGLHGGLGHSLGRSHSSGDYLPV